jgi:hypothetical protein
MKKQLIIIGITLVLITVGLSGCLNEEKTIVVEEVYDQFYGEWDTDIPDHKVWNFKTSHELWVEFYNGTTQNYGEFKVFNEQLWLFNDVVHYTYEFSVGGSVLTLSVDGTSQGLPAFIVLTKSNYQPPQGGSDNPPSFNADNFTMDDTCWPEYQKDGKVWVNFTVQNIGGYGAAVVYCRICQGTGDYQSCGNGTIYNQTQQRNIYLSNEQTKVISFVFTGINCATSSDCYGNNY